MISEYTGVVMLFLLSGALVGVFVLLASTLGKKNPTAIKAEPFECGMTPYSLPGGQMVIKFYLTAMLFILFDVEIIFLYPWAVIYRSLGMVGLVEMGIFLGILLVGYVYAWNNKALDWK